MSYPTLLLHMDLEQSNAARLAVATDLAERFDALLIGTAAANPQPPVFADGTYPVDTFEVDRQSARDAMDKAEASFRQALKRRENRIEWRDAFAPPARYVAREARAADLVITGTRPPEFLPNPNWRLDGGDLVMRAGRPILFVPEAHDRPLDARTVVLGWKDTRESRRAACDALPLLRIAGRVIVAAVAEEAGQHDAHAAAGDVAAWLGRHGIAAEARCQPLISDPATELRRLAEDEGAELIVMGAFGQSRTREWIFGGVTHDLLTTEIAQCLLMSH